MFRWLIRSEGQSLSRLHCADLQIRNIVLFRYIVEWLSLSLQVLMSLLEVPFHHLALKLFQIELGLHFGGLQLLRGQEA